MKWIRLNGKELSLGFDSAVEAEKFLLKQSTNPKWLSKFTLEYNDAYGKLQCIIKTTDEVVLNTENL